jgi:hypothetical protein
LNVRDFGAMGDGKTDGFDAFVATFAAAREQNSVEDPVGVFIPCGTYRLSRKIEFKPFPRHPRNAGEGSRGTAD